MSCDLSTEFAGIPLRLEDVEELLGADARALLREPAAARTLLLRVRATLLHDASEMKRLRTDVARMAETYKMKSAPLAAAIDALHRLTPEEQAEVFSIHAAALMETLREQMRQARQVRQAAELTGRRTRLVFGRLLEGGNLSAVEEQLVRRELAGGPEVNIPDPDRISLPIIPEPVAVPPAPGSMEALFV